MNAEYDIAVIGGGINGCGIARDAAGRGLKVLLCEKGDLASATSSASTKLIHGGLRYLEHGDFRLVRESLLEREQLLRIAPHIIRPMRFVLPHVLGMRPAWLIRLGLFLYDRMGGRRLLAATRSLDLRTDSTGDALASNLKSAYEYSDCWVDDARLVLLNAIDAAEHGADIRIRTRCVSWRRAGDAWHIVIEQQAGKHDTVSARVLINAAGFWASEVRARALGQDGNDFSVRKVQGSHIVVPKMFAGNHAYIFQNHDRRIIFAIPYENNFTLIGTTEHEYAGDGDEVEITAAERDYLLRATARFFKTPCVASDVVWTYSGVRVLPDDGRDSLSAATREYVLIADQDTPALLSVFGGKITTYRKLAEKVLDRLAPFLPDMAGKWTANAALPGGDFPVDGGDNLCAQLRTVCNGLGETVARRLVRAYGTRAFEVIGDAKCVADLGFHFGAGLYECEAVFMVNREWAKCSEDILWRRSKLGLLMSDREQQRLTEWMQRNA